MRPRPRREKKEGPLASNDHPVSKELIAATHANNVARVSSLLESSCKEYRPNVNIRDVEHEAQPTLLLIACQHGYVDIARLLVLKPKEPADINDTDKKGQTPIWWAARRGDAVLATLLLEESEQKCEVDYLDPQSGCTPLYRSVLSNSTDVCQALIHAEADVNLRRLGMNGDAAAAESPLIKSVQLNNREICELLLNSLCDKEATTADGFTALHYAVAYRRYAIAHVLLSNHVNKEAPSNRGATAMVVAIEHQNPAMCRLLIEYGYKMDASLDWHETPLEMAIMCHSEQCALTLVHWGCELRPILGKPSYFLRAACEGLTLLIKLLIDRNPYYLNEEWVRKRLIPLAFYKRPTFYEWLCQESAQPRTLKLLCRAKIYKYLGKHPCAKVTRLPLPNSLCEFVGFREHIQESMYEEGTVYSEECPYDCKAVCEMDKCPELDFSSSDENS